MKNILFNSAACVFGWFIQIFNSTACGYIKTYSRHFGSYLFRIMRQLVSSLINQTTKEKVLYD